MFRFLGEAEFNGKVLAVDVSSDSNLSVLKTSTVYNVTGALLLHLRAV